MKVGFLSFVVTFYLYRLCVRERFFPNVSIGDLNNRLKIKEVCTEKMSFFLFFCLSCLTCFFKPKERRFQ